MVRKTSLSVLVLSLLFLLTGLLACGGGGGGGAGTGSGTLNLSMTDASTDQFQAVYVTIAEVQVHEAATGNGTGGWQTILTPHQTYNLLDLVNGVFATLGSSELAAGFYGQMRLILDDTPDAGLNLLNAPHPFANYFIDNADNATELKVPSGLQTGIKIVGGFDIVASQATELILDFDAARSMVQAGNSGKWLLKPTVKILETVKNSISGQVSDGDSPLVGSLVSAQVYRPDANDAADTVFLQGATLTNEGGMYKIFLPPATYNVVAVKEGYEAQCLAVEAVGNQEYVADFVLVPVAGSGMVSGSVSGMAGAEDAATLIVRRLIDCGNGEVPVQVDSVNVAEGGDFSFTLSPGDYTLVASAAGLPTLVYDFTVSTDQNSVQDINFNQP